ncbi:MAG: hypothetical protein AAGN46_12955 [Acidobacteriota bacterium]
MTEEIRADADRQRGGAVPRRGRWKRWAPLAANLALAALATGLTLAAAEIAFRVALFQFEGEAFFATQRKPGLYADYSSHDAYWKLQYRWQKRYPPPDDPHPLLGWAAGFDRTTYLHDEAHALAGRRPVLLYGDSFAQGVPGVPRFQEILGARSSFAHEHQLLNYGVGGYGLDQIVLLMEQSLDLYDDPFVVLSFMLYDLDRSVLSVRTGQKPYFDLVDGELELRNVPIPPDPHRFFAENSPRIASYLWRRFLYRTHQPPNLVIARLRGEKPKRRHKERLNGAILERALVAIEARDLDAAIVVFHPQAFLAGYPDWRDGWLRARLADVEIPVLWSNEVLRRGAPEAELFDLVIKGNGHPTALSNRLIADEIERWVAASRSSERQPAPAERSTKKMTTPVTDT